MARPGQIAVRLTDAERLGILKAVERGCAEAGAQWQRIVVFGSRADQERKGGDIDLLVELRATSLADVYRLRQKLHLRLEDELGEQKIDVVIDDMQSGDAFVEVARAKGVVLWSND